MRIESESSMIEHFEHAVETRKLSIKFRSGKTYHYKEVPEDVVEAFTAADSHGKFFNEHIKGQYE
jgi:hypothetical protein